MLRSVSVVRSGLRIAQSSSPCLSSKVSFSSSSFSSSNTLSNTPTTTVQEASLQGADISSSPSSHHAASSKPLSNDTDALAERSSSAFSSVDVNGDPTSFDEIAQLLRTILQKEDPTWEENRSVHLPYGRRFKAVMKGPSGAVLKGTELSDLIVRLAFIKALKARFGTLETIHFGMDPTSTTFPPIAGHECSFTVLNEPVGSMPTLDETTGQKGFRLRGTLPAYFHSPPVGGPSFVDLIKLSTPVQPDFQLPNFLEPNEDEYEPYDNRSDDHEVGETGQPIHTDPSSLNSKQDSSSSTVNDRTPLTTFTIEVYPDHDWSPAEILLPDQTFSVGYPEITRSSVAYLEKWERDLWIKGFRHFEGFNGGLRQARESAASRLNLDLEKEAQAARYHDEQRRAGDVPSRISADQPSSEEDTVPERLEGKNVQGKKRSKHPSSSDPALRGPAPPQPVRPPPPSSAPPVNKTILDRGVPPHLMHQTSSTSETGPSISSLSSPLSSPPPLTETSPTLSTPEPKQDLNSASQPITTSTEPFPSSPSAAPDSSSSSSVDSSAPVPPTPSQVNPENESPSTASHPNIDPEHAPEHSGLFANLKGFLFGKK